MYDTSTIIGSMTTLGEDFCGEALDGRCASGGSMGTGSVSRRRYGDCRRTGTPIATETWTLLLCRVQ